MKIGFVIDDTLDKPDGVQQYVLTLSSWMKDQGHEVHYLVGESKRTDIANIHSLSKNVQVRFNKNRLSIPLPTSTKQITKLLNEQQFDVLHVQMPHNPLLAAKIVANASKQTAIVGTFHIAPFSKLETRATRALGLLLKQNLKRFDQIISVSSTAQTFAKKTFKVDSIVLPNVIDLAKFRVKQQKTIMPTITFLGRLVERKGAIHLLHALKIMESEHPDLRYTLRMCGDGPDRSKLFALKDTLKLQCSFDFCGYITEEEKKQYLSQTDIAVFPSTGGESFGIVLLEAMAARSGVVIGGNNSGYTSVLGEISESLIDPTNHRAFAQKLHTFLTDSGQADDVHHQQQKLVEQYDVKVVGPKIISLYKDIIAKRSA